MGKKDKRVKRIIIEDGLVKPDEICIITIPRNKDGGVLYARKREPASLNVDKPKPLRINAMEELLRDRGGRPYDGSSRKGPKVLTRAERCAHFYKAVENHSKRVMKQANLLAESAANDAPSRDKKNDSVLAKHESIEFAPKFSSTLNASLDGSFTFNNSKRAHSTKVNANFESYAARDRFVEGNEEFGPLHDDSTRDHSIQANDNYNSVYGNSIRDDFMEQNESCSSLCENSMGERSNAADGNFDSIYEDDIGDRSIEENEPSGHLYGNLNANHSKAPNDNYNNLYGNFARDRPEPTNDNMITFDDSMENNENFHANAYEESPLRNHSIKSNGACNNFCGNSMRSRYTKTNDNSQSYPPKVPEGPPCWQFVPGEQQSPRKTYTIMAPDNRHFTQSKSFDFDRDPSFDRSCHSYETEYADVMDNFGPADDDNYNLTPPAEDKNYYCLFEEAANEDSTSFSKDSRIRESNSFVREHEVVNVYNE